jgi:hypothetical protein
MQCCVERSQSFMNVSFDDVSIRPDAEAVDVEGMSFEVVMNLMDVIWSRCPRRLTERI